MARTRALATIASIALFSLTACARSEPMSPKLEGMIEDVVAATGIDIKIASHSARFARISKVNGINVCAPRAQEDVARLQTAFDTHPSNYSNIGPAFASMANDRGRRFQFDLDWLYRNGMIEDECPRISVSVLE